MTAEEARRGAEDDAVIEDAPARIPLYARVRSRGGAVFARRRNRVIAGVAVAAVALGSGTSAVYAAAQDGGGEYRTALAEIADVTETLALSGQLATADSSDVAFQVSGTVDSVLVALGDQVTAGQRLATIDATDLEQAVTSARDAVASAEQSLEDDLEAQSNGSSSSSASSTTGSAGSNNASEPGTTGSDSSGSGSGSTGSTSDDAATQKALEAVTAAQQALLEQYEAATSTGEESSSAVAQAEEICAPFLDATLTEDGQDGASATDGAEAAEGAPAESAEEQDSGSDDDPSSEDDAADGLQSALETVQAQLADCQTAIAVSEEAQSTAQAANSALTDAATALDEKVAALRKLLGISDSATPDADSSAEGAGSTGTGPVASAESSSGADSSASLSSGSESAPGSSDALSAGSGSITAERILADRAAIAVAEAELAIAAQNLTFASITSPISGTIVSVGMTVGDAVASASDAAVITVQGDGGYVVQATVTLSRITGVEVGQSAGITLPAFGATYVGEVTSIGVLNVSTTSTPSYTITISVDAGDESPRIGATADVDVQLADAVGVLTVPTSAVTRTNTGATVTRLVDGRTETSAVTLGAAGAERTEIIDGLSEGDVVVLADLNQVITADEESETGLTGLGGSNDQEFTFPDGVGIPAGGFSDSGGGFTPPGN
ncbi:HlyD family efflux transporter periplasmic adaptor subunit [Microbacterium tumbae]